MPPEYSSDEYVDYDCSCVRPVLVGQLAVYVQMARRPLLPPRPPSPGYGSCVPQLANPRSPPHSPTDFYQEKAHKPHFPPHLPHHCSHDLDLSIGLCYNPR